MIFKRLPSFRKWIQRDSKHVVPPDKHSTVSWPIFAGYLLRKGGENEHGSITVNVASVPWAYFWFFALAYLMFCRRFSFSFHFHFLLDNFFTSDFCMIFIYFYSQFFYFILYLYLFFATIMFAHLLNDSWEFSPFKSNLWNSEKFEVIFLLFDLGI